MRLVLETFERALIALVEMLFRFHAGEFLREESPVDIEDGVYSRNEMEISTSWWGTAREQRPQPKDFQAVPYQVSLSPDGNFSVILQKSIMIVATTDSGEDYRTICTYDLPSSLRSRCRAREVFWCPSSSNIFVLDGLGQDIFAFSISNSCTGPKNAESNGEMKLHLHAQDFLGGEKNDESGESACVQVIPFSTGDSDLGVFGVHLIFASGEVASLSVDIEAAEVVHLSAKGFPREAMVVDLAVHIASMKAVLLVSSRSENNAEKGVVKAMQYSVGGSEVAWTQTCDVDIECPVPAKTHEPVENNRSWLKNFGKMARAPSIPIVDATLDVNESLCCLLHGRSTSITLLDLRNIRALEAVTLDMVGSSTLPNSRPGNYTTSVHFLSGSSLLAISSKGSFSLHEVVRADAVSSVEGTTTFSLEYAQAEILPPAIGPAHTSSRAGDCAAVYCLRNIDRHTHQLFAMTAMTVTEALDAYISKGNYGLASELAARSGDDAPRLSDYVNKHLYTSKIALSRLNEPLPPPEVLRMIRQVKDDWWVCEQAVGFADENFDLWAAVVEEGLTRVATAEPSEGRNGKEDEDDSAMLFPSTLNRGRSNQFASDFKTILLERLQMLQILGDVSISLESEYGMADNGLAVEEEDHDLGDADSEGKEGDFISSLATARMNVERALEGDDKLSEVIAIYEREQEQSSFGARVAGVGDGKRQQRSPLHYLAHSLDDQNILLPKYLPNESRIALAIAEKHWFRIVCIEPLTLAQELSRRNLYEPMMEVLRMYPSLRDGYTSHGLPISLHVAGYSPLSEDPAAASPLLFSRTPKEQEYKWFLQRVLLLDSFGQTSHALRLCSLVLEAPPPGEDGGYATEVQKCSMEIILSELRMALELFCPMLYGGAVHPETEFLDWFAADKHGRIAITLEALFCSIRHPQQDTKFSDVATAIMTYLKPALVAPTNDKRDGRDVAMVHGTRAQRREFLHQLEDFVSSSGTDEGIEIANGYLMHLASLCAAMGKNGEEKTIEEEAPWERELVKILASHVKEGDRLGLKVVEAICTQSVPTFPPDQRCVSNASNLVYLVVHSLLAFNSLGKEEDIQLAWAIIETTPISLKVPDSAPIAQREDALRLSSSLDDIQLSLEICEILGDYLDAPVLSILLASRQSLALSGVVDKADARAALRDYQQKLLQGTGYLTHGLEHIMMSLTPSQGDSGSNMKLSSTGLALEQVFVLQMCASEGKNISEVTPVNSDEEEEEEEEEMYDDDNGDSTSAAPTSGAHGSETNGMKKEVKPFEALEAIQQKWLQLAQDIQALRQSSPAGHVSPLWSGLVLLRAMLTFSSTAIFTEIAVVMYEYEVGRDTTSARAENNENSPTSLDIEQRQQQRKEKASKHIDQLVELLVEMGIKCGHVEALVLSRSREIFDSVASLEDPGMRESRGLLDLLQHTEDNRECQLERALHELCDLLKLCGGVLLMPLQIRVMLCGGGGVGDDEDRHEGASEQADRTARAGELVSKIFAASPQALYTLDECNTRYFSSSEDISLDAYAKLELIKSGPRPGMRLEELILNVASAKNAHNTQNLSIISIDIRLQFAKVLLEMSDTNSSFCLALEFASVVLPSLSTFSDQGGTGMQARGLQIMDIIKQCMTLLNRQYKDSVRKDRDRHSTDSRLLELQIRDLQAAFSLSVPAAVLAKSNYADLWKCDEELVDPVPESVPPNLLAELLTLLQEAVRYEERTSVKLTEAWVIAVGMAASEAQENLHPLLQYSQELHDLAESTARNSSRRTEGSAVAISGHHLSGFEDSLDEKLIQKLMSSGFSRNGAKRSVLATMSTGTFEAALSWAVTHSDSPDFEMPIAHKVQGALEDMDSASSEGKKEEVDEKDWGPASEAIDVFLAKYCALHDLQEQWHQHEMKYTKSNAASMRSLSAQSIKKKKEKEKEKVKVRKLNIRDSIAWDGVGTKVEEQKNYVAGKDSTQEMQEKARVAAEKDRLRLEEEARVAAEAAAAEAEAERLRLEEEARVAAEAAAAAAKAEAERLRLEEEARVAAEAEAERLRLEEEARVAAEAASSNALRSEPFSIDHERQMLNSTVLESATVAFRSTKMSRAVKISQSSSNGWDDDWDDFDSFDADFDDDKHKTGTVEAPTIALANPNARANVAPSSLSAPGDAAAAAEPPSEAYPAPAVDIGGKFASTDEPSTDMMAKLSSILKSEGPGSLRKSINLLREGRLGTFATVNQALLWLANEGQRGHSSAAAGADEAEVGRMRSVDGSVRKRGWSMVVQRAAKERDGEALVEILLLDVLPLMQLPSDDLHATRDELTVTTVQAVISRGIPAPYNHRAQVLLGGIHALRALRAASTSSTTFTDPLVLLFALSLPAPEESPMPWPLAGRAVELTSWLAGPASTDDIDTTEPEALPLAQRRKLFHDLTTLTVASSSQRRRVAAVHVHRAMTADRTISLAQLENSLLALVPDIRVSSPSDCDTAGEALPFEVSPIYLALRLAASSRSLDAARLYWFSSGRPRALYSPDAAVLFFKQTVQVLGGVVSTDGYGLASSVPQATLFHIEVPPEHFGYWAALINAASVNLN